MSRFSGVLGESQDNLVSIDALSSWWNAVSLWQYLNPEDEEEMIHANKVVE
jgi:hypothetical protein